MSKILTFIFCCLILFYKRAISPLFTQSCRYTPTCSEYGLQVIEKYGPYKGGLLILKRILSCHPWGGHGNDPIP